MPIAPPLDNAGVIAPAPAIYGAAFALGLVAEFTLRSMPRPPAGVHWLGIAVIAFSVSIVVSAFRVLHRARTAFDARKATSAIVSDGAFHYSRNPTYLSLTLLYVGVCLALNLPWVLLMVVPAVALTQWGVVLREERYLNAKFGEEYRSYKSSVRQWL